MSSFQRRIMNMREKAKGNVPMRFLFSIKPLAVSGIARDVEYIVFVWQRGAKIQETKVQTVDLSKGVVYFQEGTILKQTTTCYRSNDQWEAKPYKLKIQSVQALPNGEDKTKTIGKYEVDFSIFCPLGVTGGEEEIEVNFKPRGVLRAVISSQWLKDFDVHQAHDVVSEIPYSFGKKTQSQGSWDDSTEHEMEVSSRNDRFGLSSQQNVQHNSQSADNNIINSTPPAQSQVQYDASPQEQKEDKGSSRRAKTLPTPPKQIFKQELLPSNTKRVGTLPTMPEVPTPPQSGEISNKVATIPQILPEPTLSPIPPPSPLPVPVPPPPHLEASLSQQQTPTPANPPPKKFETPPAPPPPPPPPSRQPSKKSKFPLFKKQKSIKSLRQEMDSISRQSNLEMLRQKAMEILEQRDQECLKAQQARFQLESLQRSLSALSSSESEIVQKLSELERQLAESSQVDVTSLLVETKMQLADAHFEILQLKGEISKERARNRAILNKFTAMQTQRDIMLTGTTHQQ